MGRAAGVARRRKKTANLRRRSRKVLKKVRTKQLKKTGGIACDEMREEWNMARSSKTNMANMGLSHDPNYTMAKAGREAKRKRMMDMLPEFAAEAAEPKTVVAKVQAKLAKEREAKKKAEFEVTEIQDDIEEEDNDEDDDNEEQEEEESDDREEPEQEVEDIVCNRSRKPASKVIEALEKKASIPAPKNFKFGPDTINFCVYMIDKYDDDYKAMQRDKRNYYQESAGQIKAKIKKFERICLELPD